ncbi:MAG TPA: cyclic pyranopterin monophosphate synthase MoaC [bacterium]
MTEVRMIDISDKPITYRESRACAIVKMGKKTINAIRAGGIKKGDVVAVSKIAGISAAKKTWEIIPLCHPIPVTGIEVDFHFQDKTTIKIETFAKTTAATGVEMEAMVAATVSALTVYDMCKGIDPEIRIEAVYLIEKKGGKSGHWFAKKS